MQVLFDISERERTVVVVNSAQFVFLKKDDTVLFFNLEVASSLAKLSFN